MKKLFGVMTAMVLMVSLTACGQQAKTSVETTESVTATESETTIENQTNEEQTIEEQTVALEAEVKVVLDAKDRELVVDSEAETIVVLNSDAYAIVKMLGCEEKVVAVTDSMIKSVAGCENQASVGAWNDPSVEKIIEINPSLVIGYSSYMKDESLKLLESAGIKVALFDFFNTAEVAREVEQMGILLGNEEVASEFNSFVSGYLDLVAERTAGIKDEDRKVVFWEGDTEYKTVAKGTAANEVIVASGCINLASDEETKYPEISDEWVIEKNPNIIIKTVAVSKEALGWGITDTTNAKVLYDSMVNRTGWDNIDAVNTGNVSLLSTDIALSPQGSIVGVLYLAKTAYPELFEDIDPAAVNKELKSKFLNLDIEGHIYSYTE